MGSGLNLLCNFAVVQITPKAIQNISNVSWGALVEDFFAYTDS